MPAFLILPKQFKAAGEKELTTQSTHPLPGNWNARNLITMLEDAEWA